MSLTSSFAQVVKPREDRQVAQCALSEMDADGKEINTQCFQYFPETINDQKGVEYITKNPVGSSHPIYQWVFCGGRTISFQAVFTRENAPPAPPLTGVAGILQSVDTIGSAIGNAIKNPVGTLISAIKGKDGNPTYNVDIATAIAWLRAKTYPIYPNGIAKPPPKLILYLPNSGITSGVGIGGGSSVKDKEGSDAENLLQDSIPCLMTECNVTYESFFRDGTPKIVVVDLSFVETIQVGKNWKYVKRSMIEKSNPSDRYQRQLRLPRPTTKSTTASKPANLIDKVSAQLGSVTDKFKTIA